MAYCRFSSDNWTSDVYVYATTAESITGEAYVINVAASRHVFAQPLPQWNGDQTTFPSWYTDTRDAVKAAPLVTIGGPSDGKMFTVDTPAEAVAKLRELITQGYHVPASAIEALEDESKNRPDETEE